MGVKGKQNGLCAVERDRSEGEMAVRNSLMWVACLSPRVKVTCQGPCLITAGLCVDIQDPRCQQRPQKYRGFGPPPVAMLL